MSAELINHSPDLKRLRNEGYNIEVRDGFLLVHDVPYVTSNKTVDNGTLVSAIALASPKQTTQPNSHVCYFIGGYPHKEDGSRIQAIFNSSNPVQLTAAIIANHTFSAKPKNPYPDYYVKMTTYISILGMHVKAIHPKATARTYRLLKDEKAEGVFTYIDTNSTRANIVALNEKVIGQKIAIIGLGGTGSYVLDLLAKTPVAEIHLFDGDVFLQHNAFRSPGVATTEELERGLSKVEYYAAKYGELHNGIIAHNVYVTSDNIHELADFTFVFICIDKPSAKKNLFRRLLDMNIPFVDTGMDVKRKNGGLIVMIRATAANAEKNDHLLSRVSFADDDEGENEYDDNIQIAELNMFNAAMAVFRWKKMFGFYIDLEQEFHSLFVLNSSQMVNDDTTS